MRSESRTLAADTIDPRVKLGEGHFNALYALEELGMDRMEILKTATSNVSHACEMRDLGSLEVGKRSEREKQHAMGRILFHWTSPISWDTEVN